ncbi:MAG: hypothetical protein AAF481_06915 [Acidobacteriota bacterium]
MSDLAPPRPQEDRHNVILVANPCHATPPEHEFWVAAAAAAAARGWHWLEIATRALPETPLAQSVSLPARLSDLFAKLPAPPRRSEGLTPPWISSDYLRILEDWEYRRWNLPERLPATLLGLLRLTDFVEDAMRRAQPAVVLTTNKIDHGVALFREASLYRKLSTMVVERSPLDSIWLEPNGLFAESEIGPRYQAAPARGSAELTSIGESYMARVVENPHGFRAATGPRSLPRWFSKLKKPIFFLPMDNVLWTGWEQLDHPMRQVDNPLYPSPRAAIEDLVAHAQALGGSLVVKGHPACLAISEATLPSGAHWIEGDLHAILTASDVVVTFNTKVAFPALALGLPVVTLAPNPVAVCGATYHCLDPHRVRSTLEAALAREGLAAKLEPFPPFVGWLAQECFYPCRQNDGTAHQRGPEQFVDDLIAAAGGAAEHLDAGQFESLAQDLRELAAVAPPRKAPPPPLTPPQEAPRAKEPAREDTAATRASPSLPAKALGTLRQHGVRELSRKLILWVLPRLGKGVLTRGEATLARLGVKTDELKAKVPHLVHYRRQWFPARAVPYERIFGHIWQSPRAADSPLTASGCSPQEEARLRQLAGRFDGRRATVLSGSESDQTTEAESTLTFAIDRHFPDPPKGEPDFYVTVQPALAQEVSERLKSSQQTLFFLPQRLFGLVPANSRLFWFGDTAAAPPGKEDPLPPASAEAAIGVARFLGCTGPTIDALPAEDASKIASGKG